MPTITLNGCAPVPLAHYLKALGILRLVAEDAEFGDPLASGCWSNDVFNLASQLDRAKLVEFFLQHYSPTPILAPWNGGSGFYFQEEKLKEKDPLTGKKKKTGKRNQSTEATRVVESLATSTDARFGEYRLAITETRSILERRDFDSAPSDVDKDELLVELRNRWSETAVRWLDCVLVLIGDHSRARSRTGLLPNYTTLLGSGANDGNADFSSNFMQRLQSVLLDDENTKLGRSHLWLTASLFGENQPGTMVKALAGQYSPGNAGGPNTSPGFKGESSINPWDFIFLIEGALMFAAAAVKRHGDSGGSSIAYPFAVRTSGVGYASGVAKDEQADKSNTEELWLPLWEQNTSMDELLAVLSEGRAQIGKSAATTGVDFARAVCANGTDRGFSEFVRYGFLVRRGDSSSATPLGRFRVSRNTRVELLADIEHWHARLRYKADPNRKTQGKERKAPTSVSAAFYLLQRRILELCQDNSPTRFQSLIAALGATERSVAHGFKWASAEDNANRQNIYPLHGLRPDWLAKSEDSTEFRLAASLAGMCASFGLGKEKLWFRQHLEPLKRSERAEYFSPKWTEKNPENDVAWHDGDLTDALNAILARRVMRVGQSGAKGWPDEAKRFARLDDITDFVEGRTNDDLLADLIWGLSLLDWQRVKPLSPEFRDAPEAIPSSFYAMLRLCFRLSNRKDDAIPLVPAILHRAMNGDGKTASELAARRLRGSGKAPLVKDLPVSGDIARRTAAAMLFPISHADFRQLEKMIIKPSKT
jgi:CRISPR-associated protein Csx17